MKRLVLIAALAATACAPRPAPEPVVRTVTVNVPVPVPCDVSVDRNDVDIRPLIQAAGDHLNRVEIVLDALAYTLAQRDAERAALDTCRRANHPPD
ncbi:hypothetical protein [Brevundimonas variabilis]|uniref:Lipoprotein n=1 Tax=Brevundimonas variabilis TaxID=74312 RepID=A0A7W9CKK4_9CAUL|nr:hypothetical protein [Brevundimonas variabilis]MBB5747413.1 hypothetical protein [Brevundimonas variabilis]